MVDGRGFAYRLWIAACAAGLCCGLASAAAAQSIVPSPEQPLVLDVRVIGNQTVTLQEVQKVLATRAGRPFDQGQLEKDVRQLSTKGWFLSVKSEKQPVQGGLIVTFRVVERPRLESIQYVGNKKIRAKALEKQTELKKGDPADPYAVEEGRRRMETHYHEKGYTDVQISIMEGNKPGDRKVVYLINEGKAQKVWRVRFEGNTIVNDAVLRTKIQSKPPILYLFKGFLDREKVDEDRERLYVYYRSLGYFNAKIGRELEYDEDRDWVTVVFVINEGARYKVRDISFAGNIKYDAEQLSEGLGLKAGEFFNQAKMEKDVFTVKDKYGSVGHVFADCQPDLRFDEEPGQVDLVYQISEGNRCRVSTVNIHIDGENPHTKYPPILHRVAVRPGDIADIRLIRDGERRLKYSALFNTDVREGSAPRIVVSPPDGEEGTKNLVNRPGGGSPNYRGQNPERTPSARGANSTGGARKNPSPPATIRGQDPNSLWTPRPSSPSSYGGQLPRSVAPSPQPHVAYQPPSLAPSAPVLPPRPSNGQVGQGYVEAGPGFIDAGQGSAAAPLPFSSAGDGPMAAPPVDYFGVPGAENESYVPLDIHLHEAQTGRFMVGAGVNSDAGLVGSVILEEQNFDWRRVPRGWEDFRNGTAFRGGGQKFRLEAAPGTQVQRYLFNFQEPYLFDTPVSFGLSGFFYNRLFRDWDEERLGGRVNWGYQFTPDLSGMISLRAEQVEVTEPAIPTPQDLLDVMGTSALYSVRGQLAHDTRDSTFLATQGHYIELAFEQAFGDFSFPRSSIDMRQYFILHERPDGSGRHVLGVTGRLGVSGEDTPLFERFFAGGFSTLRGFAFRGASPTVGGVTVGGEFEFMSSVEYLFPITADDMLRGVTFVDFGTVERTAHVDSENFRVAPGFGLRISIPAMGPAPIALDFAFPLAKADGDRTQVFSFFVGFAK